MTLHVVRAGYACVQDLGRIGVRHLGVPPGGAFDEWALRAGNRVCGNDDGAAGIEFVLRGPDIEFERDAIVAITGASFAATLNGSAVECGRAFRVARGSMVSIGGASGGVRGMLCVAGGVATPSILGSRSVSPRAGLGALLSAGDRLPIGSGRDGRDGGALRRIVDSADGASDGMTVRVIPGPQPFAAGALDALFSASWGVTPDADRVGVRLDGPALTHDGPPEIDPEGTVPGAIQVPGDGRPIVLGPDGPVTGGYPKIATVIAADRWIVAQARPGDRLRFASCEPAAARAAYAHRVSRLNETIRDA